MAVKIPWDELTLAELNIIKSDAEIAIATYEERARKQAMNELKQKAQEMGFDLADLMEGKKPRKAIVPKYRSPEGETWAGRGRMPDWMTEAMAKDPSLTKEDFLISK